MYARLKQAADLVGASVDKLPGVAEMKGYSKVGADDGFAQRSFEPDEAEQRIAENPAYWTVSEVCAFLRKRLLEFEGADEESVEELLVTFEDREVDGMALLELDDHTLRYELDIGAVVVRETILKIIDQLRRKPKPTGGGSASKKKPGQSVAAAAAAAQAAAYQTAHHIESFAKKMASPAAAAAPKGYGRVDGGADEEFEDEDEDEDDDDDDVVAFTQRTRSPAEQAARDKSRLARKAKQRAENKVLETRMLVRVAASVAALATVN